MEELGQNLFEIFSARSIPIVRVLRMQTVTQKYVVDAEMLRPHPRFAAFGRRSSRRQAGTSATPLPPRPPSRRATYTALTRGLPRVYVHVDRARWKNRRETTT